MGPVTLYPSKCRGLVPFCLRDPEWVLPENISRRVHITPHPGSTTTRTTGTKGLGGAGANILSGGVPPGVRGGNAANPLRVCKYRYALRNSARGLAHNAFGVELMTVGDSDGDFHPQGTPSACRPLTPRPKKKLRR